MKKAAKKAGPTKVSALSVGELRKRLSEIYKLQTTEDVLRRAFESKQASMKAGREAWTEAQAALAKAIEEQRRGPGPLYQ